MYNRRGFVLLVFLSEKSSSTRIQIHIAFGPDNGRVQVVDHDFRSVFPRWRSKCAPDLNQSSEISHTLAALDCYSGASLKQPHTEGSPTILGNSTARGPDPRAHLALPPETLPSSDNYRSQWVSLRTSTPFDLTRTFCTSRNRRRSPSWQWWCERR